MWLLAFIGCASGLITLVDTGDKAGWETENRGDPVDKLTYPDDATKKVLMYHGHDGIRSSGFDLERVKATWADAGWSVEQTAQWPVELEPFRMLAFVGTGYRAVAPTGFSDSQIDALHSALERGTRLVVMAESARCVTSNVTDLLSHLGVDIFFSGGNSSDHDEVIADDLASENQLTRQITAIQLTGPCFVKADDDWIARTDQNQPLVAVQRPGTGGDVVLLGDVEFMTDSKIDRSDNEAFVRRLAKVTP